MTLNELKRAIESAIESAAEYGESPDEIAVTIQIDDAPSGASIWSENVEVHYDGNAMTSGCVLLAVKSS